MFSWKCECDHPLLSHHSSNATNSWMEECVAVFDGERKPLHGFYDGYGRLVDEMEDSHSFNDWSPETYSGLRLQDHESDGEVQLWHLACWRAAGEPEFRSSNDNADDQGFFFEEGVHDMECPWPNVEKKVTDATT
jgi:hypothetical protein